MAFYEWKRRNLCILAVIVGLSGPALAQESAPVQPTPATAATPVPATPAPRPADAAPAVQTEQAAAPVASTQAPAAAGASDGELDADKIMAAQKAGYKIKNENGQTLLCRRDLQTGSRVRYTTSCLTARQWDQLQKDNELVLKSIERRPRMTKQ